MVFPLLKLLNTGQGVLSLVSAEDVGCGIQGRSFVFTLDGQAFDGKAESTSMEINDMQL
jgi:hypothetical protein